MKDEDILLESEEPGDPQRPRPAWVKAYTDAGSLVEDLRAGGQLEVEQVNAMIARLESVCNEVSVAGTAKQVALVRRLSLLLLEVAKHCDPDAASEIYQWAFDEIYAAANNVATLTWTGDAPAREEFPYALAVLSHVCHDAGGILRREHLAAAAAVFERTRGLDFDEQGIVATSAAMLAQSIASKPLPDVRDAYVGPARGEDALTLAEAASWHSRRAVRLLQIAGADFARIVAEEDLAEIRDLLQGCLVATVRALSFSSTDDTTAFRAVLTGCNWADDLGVSKPDRSATSPTAIALGEALAEVSAHLALAMIESCLHTIDQDQEPWLECARDLSERFWPRHDTTLPNEADGSESYTRRLSLILNLFEFTSVTMAFQQAFEALSEIGVPADDPDSSAVPEHAGAEEEAAFLQQVARAMINVLEYRDGMIIKAVASLIDGDSTEETSAPALAHVLAWVRERLSSGQMAILWQATRLAEQQIDDPVVYLQSIEHMVVSQLLPQASTFPDPDYLRDLMLRLISACTSDIQFLRADLARTLVQVAQTVSGEPVFSSDILVQHHLNRTLWMLGTTETQANAELITRSRQFLAHTGSAPREENLRLAFEIIEEIRFLIGSQRRAKLLRTDDDRGLNDVSEESLVDVDEWQRLLADLAAWASDERLETTERETADAIRLELSLESRGRTTPMTEEDSSLLARTRPTAFLSYVLDGHPITPSERHTAGRLIRADINSGVSTKFPLTLWAHLLSSGAATGLHLAPESRLHIARVLLGQADMESPTSSEATLGAILNTSDLLDDLTFSVEADELFEVAGELLDSAFRNGPTRTLRRFLTDRAGRGLHLAVTRSEHYGRLLVAMASYSVAVWLEDGDAAAVGAYTVGEYMRLAGARNEADWWYGLYDHWLRHGALQAPEQSEVRQIIELDRRSPSGSRFS